MNLVNSAPSNTPLLGIERRKNKLLTEQEAAEIARTNKNTIKYWRQLGKLAFVKFGRHPLIWESVLYQFLEVPVVFVTMDSARDKGGKRHGNF